jgi:hypothetical protein
MRSYASEANERWAGFVHRPGDIVISTRSKCGTTWVQMICALLVHGDPLPAPLAEISPWLDWSIEPLDVVRTRLDAQDHRRVIKTHTPLAGLPLCPEVTYVVVGRHPLDVAVSYFHHLGNIDRVRWAELRGVGEVHRVPERTLPELLDLWIDGRSDPFEGALDSLPGNVHHIADAWARRDDLDVVLVHYDELRADLEGTMRRLADRLGIDVAEDRWPALVGAATFEGMRTDPSHAAPDHLGVLRDHAAFFRSGRSGEGAATCTPAQLRRYDARMEVLTTPEIRSWMEGEAPSA